MKSPKKNLLKYFAPLDINDVLQGAMPSMDEHDDSMYFSRMHGKSKLYLNRYSNDELMSIMRKVGLIDHLRSRGFDNVILDTYIDAVLIHYLKVYGGEKKSGNLLIDLRLSDTRFVPEKKFFEEKVNMTALDMIVIEWLSIQNPQGEFDVKRPQLPGQAKPGLGCLRYLMQMMHIVAEGVIKDGFMDVPEHMHGAIMYSKNFKFFNPSHEGIMRAILRDLSNYSLYDLSWGMMTGAVIDKTSGKPQIYDPSEQIFPVSKRLKDYFNSKKYRKKFKQVYETKKYRLEYDRMAEKREEIIGAKKFKDL